MSVMVVEVSILHQSVAKHEADFEAVRQGSGKEERIRRTLYFQIFLVIFFLFCDHGRLFRFLHYTNVFDLEFCAEMLEKKEDKISLGSKLLIKLMLNTNNSEHR